MRKVFWFVLGSALVLPAVLSVRGPRQSHETSAAAQTAAQPPATKPAPPTPIAIKKAELGEDNTWNPEWDKFIEKSLPRQLLSSRRERQVKMLCPRFSRMSQTDRRAFWAYFFQALAGAEAGLKPTADVRHTEPEVAVIDPVTHRIARQEGLLQLGYYDSERYGCAFDWDKDKDLPEHDPEKTILQPKNNLECGIRILSNQLLVQHKPVLSETSYWVTLRPGTPGFNVFARQLANLPATCGSSRWRRQSTPGAVSAPASKANTPPREQVTAGVTVKAAAR